MSSEDCLLAVLGSEGRQSPALVGGPRRGEPNGLVGLSLYESGPLGIPGLHPRQVFSWGWVGWPIIRSKLK